MYLDPPPSYNMLCSFQEFLTWTSLLLYTASLVIPNFRRLAGALLPVECNACTSLLGIPFPHFGEFLAMQIIYLGQLHCTYIAAAFVDSSNRAISSSDRSIACAPSNSPSGSWSLHKDVLWLAWWSIRFLREELIIKAYLESLKISYLSDARRASRDKIP